MTPSLRNNKGTSLLPAASEPMGENEVAFRQRNEVLLAEHEVASGPRNEMQELGPMVQMTKMMKDL